MAAIIGLGIGAAVAIYTLNKLKSWIRARIGEWQNHRVLAGAFKEHMKNGNYRVYPLITDDTGTHVLAINAVEAEDLDADLHQAFGKKNLIQVEDLN